MRLLHVDSSARFEGSNSRALGRHFVSALRRKLPGLLVDQLDLAAEPLPHVSEAFTAAAYTPEGQRSPTQLDALAVSDALVDRLLAADAMVFGVPMYNFGMPSAFKAFLDHIVRSGRTYTWSADGKTVGSLSGRRALFITTRGADLSAGSGREDDDALTPGLRTAFGFIGLTDIAFVDAQPLQFAGDSRKEEALARAGRELELKAQEWASRAATSGRP